LAQSGQESSLTPSQILDNLPPKTDVATIILSNKPVSSKPDLDRERQLIDLPGVQLQQVGLKWVSSLQTARDVET